jgi:hypothetical protein
MIRCLKCSKEIPVPSNLSPEQVKVVRRRIEDVLRKSDAEKIMAVAFMLGVKID